MFKAGDKVRLKDNYISGSYFYEPEKDVIYVVMLYKYRYLHIDYFNVKGGKYIDGMNFKKDDFVLVNDKPKNRFKDSPNV